jgi:hypothetical protein
MKTIEQVRKYGSLAAAQVTLNFERAIEQGTQDTELPSPACTCNEQTTIATRTLAVFRIVSFTAQR